MPTSQRPARPVEQRRSRLLRTLVAGLLAPRCVARSGPVGDRDTEGGDRQQEVDDAEHGVLESIPRFTPLGRIAHRCAQEAPQCEGEQSDGQGDEEELSEWLVGEPRNRTLAGRRFVLLPSRDANGELTDDGRDDPLAHNPKPTDRLLRILRLGSDGLADRAGRICHEKRLSLPRRKLKPPGPRGTTGGQGQLTALASSRATRSEHANPPVSSLLLVRTQSLRCAPTWR